MSHSETPPPSATSLSLLEGLRGYDPANWERFARVYGPLVYGWVRRGGLGEHDAADVVQEVFCAVAARPEGFCRRNAEDSFRGWLWGITRFKILDHFRQLATRPVAVGGSDAQRRIDELPADLPVVRDERQDTQDARTVLDAALDVVRDEFEARTWQAFWRVAVDGQPPAGVGHDLGMSLGAVYNARYKVVRRLREELDGFTVKPPR